MLLGRGPLSMSICPTCMVKYPAGVSVCEADTGVFDARTGTPIHKYAFDQVRWASAVAFAGSRAYLGSGPESSFGGDVRLIAIDLRTGKYERWFPKLWPYSYATSMAISGGRVFVAGSFCH